MKAMQKIMIAAIAAVAVLTGCNATSGGAQSCEAWSADYGLTDQAVIIACETGEDAEGFMTEAEYQDRLNESLNFVKGVIDETGGL